MDEQVRDAVERVTDYTVRKVAGMTPMPTSFLADDFGISLSQMQEQWERRQRFNELDARRQAGLSLTEAEREELAEFDRARERGRRRREERDREVREAAVTVGQLIAALEGLDDDAPVRLSADPENDLYDWLASVNVEGDAVRLSTGPF